MTAEEIMRPNIPFGTLEQHADEVVSDTLWKAKAEFFLDMDGVLVNLEKGVAGLLGISSEKLKSLRKPGVWEIAPDLGFTPESMWGEHGLICNTSAKFYADLEPYPWASTLYEVCSRMGETRFLTTPTKSGACLDGKWQWIRKFAGDKAVNKLDLTSAKWRLAQPNRVLIDDKPKNIEEFEKAKGIGILFPSIGNELHAMADDPLRYVFDQIHRRL